MTARTILQNPVAIVLLCLGLAACAAQAQNAGPERGSEQPVLDRAEFRTCVSNLRTTVIGRGIPASVADHALANVEADPRVIDLDRRQPEFVLSFWRYIGNSVTPDRVAKGQQMLSQYRPLLTRVSAQYGVQPEFLVAFWGLESNYGQVMGDFPTIRSLATLACDDRRADFFTNELVEALRMVAVDHFDPATMKGSWAGAFGNTQFMPSTFTRYAVDYDGDNRRDLFRSLPDVFASSANFLSRSGWKADQRAAIEVTLPPDFPWDQADPSIEKSVAEWSAMGVRRVNGAPLGPADTRAAIGLPAGHRGPAFLLLPNFKVIMVWNRSLLYGLAVSILADRIVGLPGMTTVQTYDEPPLSIADVTEMQVALKQRGFYAGEADGMVGPKTRAAIRAYQHQAGIPADGFPDQDLMSRLRNGG